MAAAATVILIVKNSKVKQQRMLSSALFLTSEKGFVGWGRNCQPVTKIIYYIVFLGTQLEYIYYSSL